MVDSQNPSGANFGSDKQVGFSTKLSVLHSEKKSLFFCFHDLHIILLLSHSDLVKNLLRVGDFTISLTFTHFLECWQ